MENNKGLIILFILLIIYIYFLMLTSSDKRIKKYCRINDKKIGSFLEDVFNDQQFQKTNNKKECDLFIPSADYELKLTKFPSNTIINTIDNINELNKKNRLWKNLVDKWGKLSASRIIPESFNILDKIELRRFAKDFLSNKSNYILKNEQESAQGILVSNNMDRITGHILKKKYEGYPVTVIQKIIKSFLINGHVFKIRMFLLIKCDKNTGKKHFYLHKLGSIFYAPEKYNKRVKTNNNTIANGYWYNTIDHTDYVSFINDKPKTLSDLLKYLKKMDVNTVKLMIRIRQSLILVFKSIEDRIYKSNLENDQFCILGFDVMIDDNYKPWLIEFNKGPSTKDYDDIEVYNAKKKVWNDMYNLVSTNNNHSFKEIYTN